jgi:hypothetical protein
MTAGQRWCSCSAVGSPVHVVGAVPVRAISNASDISKFKQANIIFLWFGTVYALSGLFMRAICRDKPVPGIGQGFSARPLLPVHRE